MKTTNLGYLVAHPIQYQSPLLRRVAQEPGIQLTVFFCSDHSARAFVDKEFNRTIQWDVPLLDGFDHEFLPTLGDSEKVTFFRPFNYGLLKRLKRKKIDVLWIHGYARSFHWIAILQARLLGIKVLIRDEATTISAHRGGFKRSLKEIFFSILNRLGVGFLAIGRLNRDYYLGHGVPADRIHLMPYAVDNSFFQEKSVVESTHRDALRRTLELPEGPIFLYVGKLTRRKRALELLEAYAALSPNGDPPPGALLFVGDGEERPQLESRLAALGWRSVRLLGFKNQTELPKYYALCDVFVMPAIHEPWGLVVNEVMNAGRAVIISNQVGCMPDLVRHGENGLVYEADNLTQLTQCLKKFIDEPELARDMGRRSLERIKQWSFEEDAQGLRSALPL